MHVDRLLNPYLRLRAQASWSLLASDNGPVVIAILQTHLGGEEKSLLSSIFHERVERDLEELRGDGHKLPQTAQQYISEWLRKGFLERRFPEGTQEETYSLSAAASTAIRYANGLLERRVTATESRLAVVIHQLSQLAIETNPNPQHRISALLAERERIDREIASIQTGAYKPLNNERASERIREIIHLAYELSDDFKSVRNQFDELNRDLRERLVEHEGSRGQVLNQLFDGIDVIAESDAGRTFAAFWRLLTDPSQGALLDDSLEQILSRPFVTNLSLEDRRFLLRLTKVLLDESEQVHDVIQNLAKSLKQFVQSSEYLEQRRLSQLIREAQRLGINLKESLHAHTPLGYDLALTTVKVRSLAQWTLFDPSLHKLPEGMRAGEAAPLDLETVANWVSLSEINFKELKSNIAACLDSNMDVTIREILDSFPASQGLGSIVGYLTLANRFASVEPGEELVRWRGTDQQWREARVPVVRFLKEKRNELF